ncbi:hypothetical protein QOT17_014159 [Balamuthia mandrillaris]
MKRRDENDKAKDEVNTERIVTLFIFVCGGCTGFTTVRTLRTLLLPRALLLLQDRSAEERERTRRVCLQAKSELQLERRSGGGTEYLSVGEQQYQQPPMSATRNNFCGTCLSWTALALLFFSLLIPWYLTSIHIEDVGAGTECTDTFVFFWAHYVPSSSGDCAVDIDVQANAFWGEKDNHLDTVFAPTFFLMLFTTIIALLAAVVFSARCCCMQADSSRTALLTKAALILNVLGMFGLAMAIIIFAALLPNAWKANVDDETEVTHGPWDSFIGHDERELNVPELSTVKGKLVWVPVGWWIALLAWPFLVGTVIALFTASRSTNRQHGYSIINQ